MLTGYQDLTLLQTSIEPLQTAQMMADFPAPWCICGGWAIDLFVDCPTRAHKDVDIAVLRRDQLALRRYLRARGWILEKAHQGRLSPWREDEFIELPLHTIWCKHPANRPDFFEILLNEATPTHFLFRRDPAIMLPFNQAFLQLGSGLPVLAPEIVLLYKAKNPLEAGNRADFETALPYLDAYRRGWLKVALTRLYPGHLWLKRLK
jgi:hypothetical protein